LKLLQQVRDMALHDQFTLTEVPIVDVYNAQDIAERGDLDGALRQLRAALDDFFNARQTWCIPVTAMLVELLLCRGMQGDLAEAEAAVIRLAALPTDDVWAARDITVLRLRALLARARGDEALCREFAQRHREMATSLGFEGHLALAETTA
jgi:hypothetical protein